MKFFNPHTFLIASTAIEERGFDAFLKTVGAENWYTDAPSDGEKLIEAAGKLCYRSFNLDHNPNLSRVRTGRNRDYIQDSIVATKHGSVLEHVQVSFALLYVSRILTHELVRHRPGSGFSQESMRFVRLTEIPAYWPQAFSQQNIDSLNAQRAEKGLDPLEISEEDVKEIFVSEYERAEQIQEKLSKMFRLDEGDFASKKKVTSAMRRLAPGGVSTHIIYSSNLRALRYQIPVRTHPSAEEEIRIVFNEIFQILKKRFPNVFEDGYEAETVDGIPVVQFKHEKV